MINQSEIITFWTGIMRDHGTFFLMNLSSKEIEFIEGARYYKEQFTKIHNESKNQLNKEFINELKSLLMDFINFKCVMLNKLLTCDIELGLPPTFINHTINEALEFLEDINKIQNPVTLNPVLENINLHKIWLPDTSGHATTIMDLLDPTEKEDIEKAKCFAKDFDELFLKANELEKMLNRTNLDNGALNYLNEQAAFKLSLFLKFLSKIKKLTVECKLLGVLKPIMPDHMIREGEYYLKNIQMYSN